MDDLLVGYLLQTLDADERREAEERLRRDPVLRDRLALLKINLAPLALDADAPEPPPGLVLSTLARVAEEQCRHPAPAPRRPVPSPGAAPARRGLRRADVAAAAVLLLLVGGLAFPWLMRQWHEYQVRACQRNLSVFWNGLQFHSDIHDGAFPRLEEEGARSFAGIFVPLLNDNKLLDHDANILCPAVGKRRPDGRSVRDLELIWNQCGHNEFRGVIRDVGGSYAYPLGYRDGSRLLGLNREDNDHQPIMADAPGSPDGRRNSGNHGGRGQNVLFIGGQVQWYTTRAVGPDGDDIFLNENGEVAAGLHRQDVVLGGGDACPFPCRRP